MDHAVGRNGVFVPVGLRTSVRASARIQTNAERATFSIGGATMLHAQASRNKELIATLISKDRWACRVEDSCGLTPLHVAASVGNSNECLELLLMRADPNARTISGVTPLHLAARSKSSAAAHVLLEHGANAEVRDCWGLTSLAIAIEVDDYEISSRVLRQNADPWSVSESGVSITQRLGNHQGIRDALALFQKTSIPPNIPAEVSITSVQSLMKTCRERTELESSHIRNKNRITQVRLEECLTKLQQDEDQLAASKAATKVLDNLALSAMESHAVDWGAFAETTSVVKNTGALAMVQGADPIESFKHILRHNATLQEDLSAAKQNIRNSVEERAKLDEALALSKLELHALKHKFRIRDKQAKEYHLAQQELRLTAEVKSTEAYVSKVAETKAVSEFDRLSREIKTLEEKLSDGARIESNLKQQLSSYQQDFQAQLQTISKVTMSYCSQLLCRHSRATFVSATATAGQEVVLSIALMDQPTIPWGSGDESAMLGLDIVIEAKLLGAQTCLMTVSRINTNTFTAVCKPTIAGEYMASVLISGLNLEDKFTGNVVVRPGATVPSKCAITTNSDFPVEGSDTYTFRGGEQIIIYVRLSDFFGNLCRNAENESIIVSIASFRSVFKAPEYYSEEPGISACRFSLKDRGTHPIGITLNKQHALQTLQIKIIPGLPDATQSFASISNIASIVRPSSQYMMYINARDIFGNDCTGGHAADEFTVDMNGISVEMYILHPSSPRPKINTDTGNRTIEINTARRGQPDEEKSFKD